MTKRTVLKESLKETEKSLVHRLKSQKDLPKDFCRYLIEK
jgi:hypothetical protein